MSSQREHTPESEDQTKVAPGPKKSQKLAQYVPPPSIYAPYHTSPQVGPSHQQQTQPWVTTPIQPPAQVAQNTSATPGAAATPSNVSANPPAQGST